MFVLPFPKCDQWINSYEVSNMWQTGGVGQDQVPCVSNQANRVVHPGSDYHSWGLLWRIAASRESSVATSDPKFES